MNTSWKIINTKRTVDTEFVIEVTYAILCSIENEKDRYINKISYEIDSINSEFITFENLTEEIIIQWVKESLGDENIKNILTTIEKRIQERIYIKNNPEYSIGVPWKN